MTGDELDKRFYYEPILSGHPDQSFDVSLSFLNHQLNAPIWISSMTGGTEKAKLINSNLAKACGEYGLGMGLGSCRALLESNERLSDFDMRPYMRDQPLYANLGVAQIEELILSHKLNLIQELIDKLNADGLIIHVNPLQEWLQPEGDRYYMSPIEMIKRIIDAYPELSLIVKEVGQGMGPKSLEALYDLPVDAVDFGAGGGTNFALLELHRSDESTAKQLAPLAHCGHDAEEMVIWVNNLMEKASRSCKHSIISGGIRNYLDGYYHISKMNSTAIYGQASVFLRHALEGYEELQAYIESQISGLQVANKLLVVK